MAPRPLAGSDMKRISDVRNAYSKGILAGDAPAASAVFTDDAIFLDPNSTTIRGKAEIEKFFVNLFADQKVLGFQLTPLDLYGVESLAYEVGTWQLSLLRPQETSPVSHSGSYVLALKKQIDGTWKIAVDIGNSSSSQ